MMFPQELTFGLAAIGVATMLLVAINLIAMAIDEWRHSRED